MRTWKVIGLAGLAGVAATGVAVARSERKRSAYTPDEIRERLRERAAGAAAEGSDGAGSPGRRGAGTEAP